MTRDLTAAWELRGVWSLPPGSGAENGDTAGAHERAHSRRAGNPPSASASAVKTEPEQESASMGGTTATENGSRPPPATSWPAYGPLSYSPQERFRLKALGPQGNPLAPTPNMLTVWGELLDGTPCSLLDAYESGGTATVPGRVQEQELSANTVVYNAHVRGVDDLVFEEWWLETTGLLEFLWHGGRGAKRLAPSTSRSAAPDDRELAVKLPGATLTFRLEWDRAGDAHRDSRDRRGRVRILLDEPASYTDCRERWLTPLQNLVAFATREPVHVISVCGVRYDTPPERTADAIVRPGFPRELLRNPVEFLVRTTSLIRPPRSEYGRLLFGLAELGDDVGRILETWLGMHAKLATGRDVFFATLASRLYVENELLNLMSAAEGYHRTFHDTTPLAKERHKRLTREMLSLTATESERALYQAPLRHANRPSQRDRLHFLFDRATDVIPRLRLQEDFVAQLVDTRNYLTHLGDRTPHVIRGVALRRQLNRLILVLQVNYLRELGFSTDHVATMIRRSYHGSQEEVLNGLL